jgi:hypothetical protein
MKIERLTKEQKSKIEEYREKYFGQAVSTEPADRARAEVAALKIAKIAGVEISSVVWVDSPKQGDSLRGSLWDSLRDSLRDSLGDSLGDSLRDSLGDSLGDSLWDSLGDSLRDSLGDSLWDSLGDSLRDSLGDSLGDSLRDSLGDSLRDSLGDSLWDSLWDSLGDSLWDTGWLAFYSFCAEELNIKIDELTREKLRLHNEIAASCFAFWIVPGTIILCERPSRIEITNGKLVGIEWR